MRKAGAFVAAALLISGCLVASDASLILPVAVSESGADGTYRRTDLRVFNTSYSSSAAVRTVYHCRGGGSCAAVASEFTVGPRQNVAIDDPVTALFGSPGTEGAIEFLYDDGAGPLVVTARLCVERPPSASCCGALSARRPEEALTNAVFNQVTLSADSASGLRTETGGFNPGSAPVTATATLWTADGRELGSVSRTFGPKEFSHFEGTIGDDAGGAGVTAADLSLTVAADGPFFPWAALIDNRSGDLTLLEPAQDAAPPEAVPLVVVLSRYRFSPGGPDGPPIRLEIGVTYRITFRAIDVEHGISGVPRLGISARSVAPGDDYVVTVTPTSSDRGVYNFACTHVCGVGHGDMHAAIEVGAATSTRLSRPHLPRTIPERIRN